jgi:predicted porin
MKKSLVALAVLAASGASFAQSSVTLYGLADIWVGQVDDGSQTQTKIDSGGVNTSRWGIKGSEDLGGGLKAIFKLEQGFKLDTGAGDTAGQAFSRQAYVGLAGGFGEVAFGKVWSAYDDVSGASNAVFDSALAPLGSVFRSGNYQDRISNAVRYTTPEMAGFTGAFSYGLDEGAANGLTSTSVSVSYGAGPLALQFGYQVDDLNGKADEAEFLRVGGSWNFGMAALKATYGKVYNYEYVTNADAEEYQIGVDIPLGAALVVSASYAASEGSGALSGFDNDGYGIGAAYTLSKRTFLYGGYKSVTTSAPATADVDSSLFAIGVNHKF